VKFLVDQDVYALSVRFLRGLGHDVITAAEIGLSRATDTVLLGRASQEGQIFVTRDKDFGGLVFVGHLGKGVILLRTSPATLHGTHEELRRVLVTYSEAELGGAFVVVEPGQHRFRKLG
jgi:predicted nuclease of predicted toxin-antitoxin system